MHIIYIHTYAHIYIYSTYINMHTTPGLQGFSSCQESDPRSDSPCLRAKEDPRSVGNAWVQRVAGAGGYC